MAIEINKKTIEKSINIIQNELNKLLKLIEAEPVKDKKKTISQTENDYTTQKRARRKDEMLPS